MRQVGIVVAAALLAGAAGLAQAQQTIKGKVAAVDKAAGQISLQIGRIAGTAGSGANASIAPTPFKVVNPRLLDAITRGDRVTVTSETVNGVRTITNITKE